MKKSFFYTIAILLSTFFANAQAPQKISYQAVVRNSSNNLIVNAKVGMRLTILQGSISGSAVYVETQSPTTNANGLISIEIGGGVNAKGSFDSIEWPKGPYFAKTEIDPSGGTNYTISSVSQLLSVPFALYAEKSSTSIYQTKHIAAKQLNTVQAWTVIDSLIVTDDGDYLLTWNIVSSDEGNFGFNKNQTSSPGITSPFIINGASVSHGGYSTQPGYFTGTLAGAQLKKNDIVYLLGRAQNIGATTFGDAGGTWGNQSFVSLIKIK